MAWWQAFLTLGPDVTPGIFALLCGISFFGSFATAMLGLGGGVLMLAVLALVFPPTVVVPLHGAVQLGSNLGRAAIMWRQALWRIVPAFAVGSALGAAAGANVVLALPLWALQLVLAVFLLYAVWGPSLKAVKASRATFFLAGALGTFAAMFVGTTGPLIAPFVAAAAPDRRQVVATQGAFMVFQHGLKIVAFGFAGFVFQPYAALLAAMLGFGLLGTFIGSRLLLKLPEESFRLAFRIVLTLLALRLAWSAVAP